MSVKYEVQYVGSDDDPKLKESWNFKGAAVPRTGEEFLLLGHTFEVVKVFHEVDEDREVSTSVLVK